MQGGVDNTRLGWDTKMWGKSCGDGVGHAGVEWVMQGGVDHTRVEWVMQGWGGSYKVGVGYKELVCVMFEWCGVGMGWGM